METRSTSEKVIPILLKTLGFFALFEAVFCLILALLFKLALSQMLLPYCLFFLPALLSLPLVLSARRFIHKPKVYALLAALGMSMFAALNTIAMHFSGMFRWMFSGGISGGELIFVVIFAVLVAAVSGYWRAQKIANSVKA
jgi:uncharacterized membrane protein